MRVWRKEVKETPAAYTVEERDGGAADEEEDGDDDEA